MERIDVIDLLERVSIEQFRTASNKNLPSKWIKFVFRYFSKDTAKRDLWLKRSIFEILIGLFVFGFIGTIFSLSRPFIGVVTYSLSFMLVLIALTMGSGVILNNLRIRKIRKELGVSKAEYNILVDLYEEK